MHLKMELIGLLLNLAALIALTTAGEHEHFSISPSSSEIVKFTNDSLYVICNFPADTKVHWKNPKGDVVRDNKGRVHVEEKSSDQMALVFEHIALGDRGDWTCEEVEGEAKKSFKFIVYQKIHFLDHEKSLTVREGKNATIRCEVKGDPEPSVSWYFKGEPIEFTPKHPKYKKLADGLLIIRVQQNDSGEYTCKAFQISAEMTDIEEHTVHLKIEHKPMWLHHHHHHAAYGYIGGVAHIVCEAIAEPPANFSWYRHKKRLHPDKHTILNDTHSSTLEIHVKDSSVFDTYKCKASNPLGSIERSTKLEEGTKPPPPKQLQLRGFNSNTFDVDVGAHRTSAKRTPMDVNGFRFEYITDYDFKAAGGNWSYAKQRDFPFEDGATFLINNLEANTTYFMRVASKNQAGLSDWTRVEKFTTISNEPPVISAAVGLGTFNCIFVLVLSISISEFSPIRIKRACRRGVGQSA